MYSILVLPNSDPCIHKEVHKSKNNINYLYEVDYSEASFYSI